MTIYNSGGIVAARGFMFQYLKALQECFNLVTNGCENWSVDVEDTDTDISDITIRVNGNIEEIQQIKMSSDTSKTIGPSELIQITEKLFTADSKKYKIITNRQISPKSQSILLNIQKFHKNQSSLEELKREIGQEIFEKFKYFITSDSKKFLHIQWLSTNEDIPKLRNEIRETIVNYRANNSLEKIGPQSSNLIVSALIDSTFVAATAHSGDDRNPTSVICHKFLEIINSSREILSATIGISDFDFSAGTLPNQVSNYVERQEIKEITKHFNFDDSGAGKIVGISGMSGSGKSSLAQSFAIKFLNNYYDICIWVDASTDDTISSSLAQVFPKLQTAEDDIKNFKRQFREYLETCRYNILFIFDNAVSVSTIKTDWSIDRKHYYLVTSLDSNIPSSLHVVHLNRFTEFETEKFIKSALNIDFIDSQSLSTLKSITTQLPLALAMTCSYLKNFYPNLTQLSTIPESEFLEILGVEEDFNGKEISVNEYIINLLKKISARNNELIKILSTSSIISAEIMSAKLIFDFSLKTTHTRTQTNSLIRKLRKYSLVTNENPTDETLNDSEYYSLIGVNKIIRDCAAQVHRPEDDPKSFIDYLNSIVSGWHEEDRLHEMDRISLHSDQVFNIHNNCFNSIFNLLSSEGNIQLFDDEIDYFLSSCKLLNDISQYYSRTAKYWLATYYLTSERNSLFVLRQLGVLNFSYGKFFYVSSIALHLMIAFNTYKNDYEKLTDIANEYLALDPDLFKVGGLESAIDNASQIISILNRNGYIDNSVFNDAINKGMIVRTETNEIDKRLEDGDFQYVINLCRSYINANRTPILNRINYYLIHSIASLNIGEIEEVFDIYQNIRDIGDNYNIPIDTTALIQELIHTFNMDRLYSKQAKIIDLLNITVADFREFIAHVEKPPFISFLTLKTAEQLLNIINSNSQNYYKIRSDLLYQERNYSLAVDVSWDRQLLMLIIFDLISFGKLIEDAWWIEKFYDGVHRSLSINATNPLGSADYHNFSIYLIKETYFKFDKFWFKDLNTQ